MKVYTDLLPKTKSEKHGAFTWEPARDNATTPVAGTLTITGKRSHCRYRVEESPADEPGRAFLLFKLDAGTDKQEERYGCFLATSGFNLCECRGFTATRSCKHLLALAELVTAGRI